MQQLILYQNPQFGEVRTVLRDKEPWFVAVDVCKVLGLGQVTRAMSKLDEDEVSILKVTHPQSPEKLLEVNCVNEPGLYHLIFTSRKPEAKAFQRWVYHEVLPSIRKKSMYAQQQSTYALFNALEEANLTNPSIAKPLAQATKAFREQKAMGIFIVIRDTDVSEMEYAACMGKLWGKDIVGQSESVRNFQKYRRLMATPYTNYHEEEEEQTSQPVIEPNWQSVFDHFLATAEGIEDVQVYHSKYIKLGIPHYLDSKFYQQWRRWVKHFECKK